jgi:hypothetical protein
MRPLNSLSLRIIIAVSFFSIGILTKTSAQSITYFPFNSVLGISTNPNNKVWGDLRLFTNSYFTSVTADISPQFNIVSTPRANYYLGAGVKFNTYNVFNNYNPVEGYFMNAGVRARPFDKYKKVQVIFEISPYAVREMDAGLFRTMLGIGYNFSQKK